MLFEPEKNPQCLEEVELSFEEAHDIGFLPKDSPLLWYLPSFEEDPEKERTVAHAMFFNNYSGLHLTHAVIQMLLEKRLLFDQPFDFKNYSWAVLHPEFLVDMQTKYSVEALVLVMLRHDRLTRDKYHYPAMDEAFARLCALEYIKRNPERCKEMSEIASVTVHRYF